MKLNTYVTPENDLRIVAVHDGKEFASAELTIPHERLLPLLAPKPSPVANGAAVMDGGALESGRAIRTEAPRPRWNLPTELHLEYPGTRIIVTAPPGIDLAAVSATHKAHIVDTVLWTLMEATKSGQMGDKGLHRMLGNFRELLSAARGTLP